MKRFFVALTIAGAMLAPAATSALAAPGDGNNCVGAAVSEAAHETQQIAGEGFGDFAHDQGINPGQAIQAFHATC
jgi:hypothetical protein